MVRSRERSRVLLHNCIPSAANWSARSIHIESKLLVVIHNGCILQRDVLSLDFSHLIFFAIFSFGSWEQSMR